MVGLWLCSGEQPVGIDPPQTFSHKSFVNINGNVNTLTLQFSVVGGFSPGDFFVALPKKGKKKILLLGFFSVNRCTCCYGN